MPAKRRLHRVSWIREQIRVGVSQKLRRVCVQGIVTEESENGSVEVVRAALGDRVQRAAATARVLGVVLLRNDAELLDGRLRERIPLARVLPDDTAHQHVVLEADAVEEDVHVVRALGAAGDAAALRADAGRHEREGEEVAVVDRNALDLLERDVGRDLRRHRLHGPLRLDGDRLQRNGLLGQAELQAERLADQQPHGPLLLREPDR